MVKINQRTKFITSLVFFLKLQSIFCSYICVDFTIHYREIYLYYYDFVQILIHIVTQAKKK